MINHIFMLSFVNLRLTFSKWIRKRLLKFFCAKKSRFHKIYYTSSFFSSHNFDFLRNQTLKLSTVKVWKIIRKFRRKVLKGKIDFPMVEPFFVQERRFEVKQRILVLPTLFQRCYKNYWKNLNYNWHRGRTKPCYLSIKRNLFVKQRKKNTEVLKKND